MNLKTKPLDVRFSSYQRNPNVIKLYINGNYYEGFCEPGIVAKFNFLFQKSQGKALNYLKKHCTLERVQI